MASRSAAQPRARARLRAGGRRVLGAGALVGALTVAGCSTASDTTQSVTISGNKNLIVYISAPPKYTADPTVADVVDAEKLAFSEHASEVTAVHLHMRVVSKREISANARSAIEMKRTIAYIGEIVPGDSEQSVGITNAQDVLQVSPTDTALELTQRTPVIPGGPKHFYEATASYGRTFGRVVPTSAVEAKAQVIEMKSLGVTHLAIQSDTTTYGKAFAHAVKADAASSGITVTSSLTGADGVFYAGTSPATAAKALSGAPSTAKIFVPSALDTAAFATAMNGRSGVYVSFPGVYPTSQLPAAGQAFLAAFKRTYGHAPAAGAIFGYEAMSAVIDAIHNAGSKATNRSRVVRDFEHIKNRSDSVIGPYSISAGDTSQTNFVFSQLRNGTFTPTTQVAG